MDVYVSVDEWDASRGEYFPTEIEGERYERDTETLLRENEWLRWVYARTSASAHLNPLPTGTDYCLSVWTVPESGGPRRTLADARFRVSDIGAWVYDRTV